MRGFVHLKKKWKRLWNKPIQVFVFHHVSEERNPLIAAQSDWTQLEQFKKNICQLQKEFCFISLEEAWHRLQHDRCRFREFAVLTADDGYRSILGVLPWLEQHGVPITIFVNTKYLDKKSWGKVNEDVARKHKPDVDMLSEVCPELFLSKEELFALDSPLISVGMHGHEHLNAVRQSEEEFCENVEKCKSMLSSHKRFVPFYAYTWGRHNAKTDKILKEKGMVPVTTAGNNNYHDQEFIDRICIDGKNM